MLPITNGVICDDREMNKDHVVQKYMDIFYHSGDLDNLYGILSSDLKFEGPLFQFDNAEAYINSLKESPPKDCGYEVIEEYINEHSVCLIYIFIKGKKETLMAQTFLLESGLIKNIRLIFNAQAIT
jgi:hypothetical protein